MATYRGKDGLYPHQKEILEFIMNLDYASVEERIVAYYGADAEAVHSAHADVSESMRQAERPGFVGRMESRFVTNCIDLKPSEWRRV